MGNDHKDRWDAACAARSYLHSDMWEISVRRTFASGLMLALTVARWKATARGATAYRAPSARLAECRAGYPLASVYAPARLQIRLVCVAMTGVITRVEQESDGDRHVNVRPDAPARMLVNDRNRYAQYGDLMTEIIPADQASIAAPEVGVHGRAVGPPSAHGL